MKKLNLTRRVTKDDHIEYDTFINLDVSYNCYYVPFFVNGQRLSISLY